MFSSSLWGKRKEKKTNLYGRNGGKTFFSRLEKPNFILKFNFPSFDSSQLSAKRLDAPRNLVADLIYETKLSKLFQSRSGLKFTGWGTLGLNNVKSIIIYEYIAFGNEQKIKNTT